MLAIPSPLPSSPSPGLLAAQPVWATGWMAPCQTLSASPPQEWPFENSSLDVCVGTAEVGLPSPQQMPICIGPAAPAEFDSALVSDGELASTWQGLAVEQFGWTTPASLMWPFWVSRCAIAARKVAGTP